MTPLARDYFLLALMASTGVLQMALAYAGLRGLLFVRSRIGASLLGLALVVSSFLWFYLPGRPNIGDNEGGMNGNTQSYLFTSAASAALVLTLVLSSIRNFFLGKMDKEYPLGLEALREANYVKALFSTLRRLWKQLRKLTLQYYSG